MAHLLAALAGAGTRASALIGDHLAGILAAGGAASMSVVAGAGYIFANEGGSTATILSGGAGLTSATIIGAVLVKFLSGDLVLIKTAEREAALTKLVDQAQSAEAESKRREERLDAIVAARDGLLERTLTSIASLERAASDFRRSTPT